MSCMQKSYEETDLHDRRAVIASAIASQRIEGLELDADTSGDFKEFSEGLIDLNEVRSRIEARFTVQEPSSAFDI